MILGQLRMGARQAKNAPLRMADEEGGYNKMIGLLTKCWASTVYPTCVPSKHRTWSIFACVQRKYNIDFVIFIVFPIFTTLI